MNTKETTSKAVMSTAASEARRSVLGGLLGWRGRAGRQFVWSVSCFVVALLAASVLVAPSGAAGSQAAEPGLAGTGQAAGQVAEPDSAKADEIGEAGGAVEPVVPVASVVRVGGSGVAEGGSREFRVGLSAAAAEVVKVSYGVVAELSTAGLGDYVLSPAGAVVFAAGETAKTVILTTVDDAIDEPGEVVTLGLLAGSGYAVSSVGGSAEVKILDNDAPPVVSISSGGSAVEGDEVVLTVSLSAASGYGLSVPYGVVAGSSTASSSDYVLSPAGAVVFAAGETSKTVTVATVDDDADEPDEQVTVQLGAGSNYAVSSSAGSAVVWVKDNDEPAPPGPVEPAVPVASIVRAGGSGVAEGGSREFTVGLSAAAAAAVTVAYSVAAASSTAGVGDYVLSPAGSVTFAAGETAKTVTITAVDDAVDEPGEVVTLGLLAGSGYAVSSAGGSAEVKILDNDAPPVASISSGGSAVEGSAVSLTVSLSAPSGYGLSVPYSVVAGSTTAGSSDYVLSPAGAVVFAAGETSKTVTVATVDDEVDEPDEQVTVQLGVGYDYAVSSVAGSAVVWIRDNDEPAPVTTAGPDEVGGAGGSEEVGVTGAAGASEEVDEAAASLPVASIVRAGAAEVTEGESRGFTVGLSVVSARAVTVGYGVVAGSSTAGSGDYSFSPSGSVTFAPGETSKTVTLAAVDDAADEPSETVTVELLAGVFHTVSSAAGSAAVSILDNDTAPVVSLSGGAAVEGSGVVFTVSLSAVSGYELSVPYGVVAGSTTAEAGDYDLPAGPLVFAAGEVSKTVTMTTVDDTGSESAEKVTVLLGAGSRYTVSSAAGSAVGWINDNDNAVVPVVPTARIGFSNGSYQNAVVVEGESRNLTVSLSQASTNAVTVAFGAVEGRYAAGLSDYSFSPSGSVTFAPGETAKTVVLTVVDDDIYEHVEFVWIALLPGSGYTASYSASARLVIRPNDVAPLVSISSGGSAVEGGEVVFTVSLSAASSGNLAVSYSVVAADTTAGALDYSLSPAGSVGFVPGEVSKTVTMATVDDSVYEPAEKVTVRLGAGSGYAVSSAAGSAVGWINDNDDLPVVSLSGGSAVEGSAVSLSVSLSAPSAYELSVPYGVVAADTTAGPSDYFLPAGPLVFAAGETAKTIDLLTFHDGVAEQTEKVTVRLDAGANYSVSSTAGSAEAVISDNAAALGVPVASIARLGAYDLVEGQSRDFLVSLALL